MKCVLGDQSLYIKILNPLQKSTKETKMIENSQFFTKRSHKDWYIHFRSVFILQKHEVQQLNNNINKILPKGNACLNGY